MAVSFHPFGSEMQHQLIPNLFKFIGGPPMRYSLRIILLLLAALAACSAETEADPLAIVDEPGVVTVFKSPA